MPRLNIEVLLATLNAIQMSLYDIWVECRNNDLAEAIEKQRNKIIAIITTLEKLPTADRVV
jgi:hypothetical protein